MTDTSGGIRLYHPRNRDRVKRPFRGTGVITEEQVMAPLREWFMEKPRDARIITRGSIEGLMGVSSKSENILKIRKEITAICNRHFPLYSPNTKTKSWKITVEGFN